MAPLNPERIWAEKRSLEFIISLALSQAPIEKELRIALSIASALCKRWTSIAEVCDKYDKERRVEVTNTTRTNIVHDILSSLQTEIAWTTISPLIPKEHHDVGKRILTEIINGVTSEEIKLVRQFLRTRVNKKLVNHTNYEVKQGDFEAIKEVSNIYGYRRQRKLPKEMRYV
jgi:hypothetical protein